LAALLAMASSGLHAYLFQVFGSIHGSTEFAGLRIVQEDYNSMFGLVNRYVDFYIPFGVFVVLATLLEGVILWQVAWIEQAIDIAMKPLTFLFMLAEGGYAWLMWQAGFSYPLLVHMLMVLLLAMATVLSGKRKAKTHWSQSYVTAMRKSGHL
jgi:hypothetical protein